MWEEEGRPSGRADVHWDKARELVAIEESEKDTLLPNPQREYEDNPTTEPVEPLLAVKNEGEFPTLTDEGEDQTFPDRANVAGADEPPLKTPTAARKKGGKKAGTKR
jgi:hypothetical protein